MAIIWRARKQIILREFNRWIAHALVREGEKGKACLLTLLLLELNIWTPGRGITRGRGFMRSRGGLRSAAGKENVWLLFTHLKPKAEGHETEILTKLHSNHKNRMRKPQTYNLLICVGHSERWIAHTAWRYSPAPPKPRGWWSQRPPR